VLLELARKDCLDEKLAEYAFFPLTHIFNQTQQASVRCLELAVRCLEILISKGWRLKLSAQLGKQLFILLTILAGGTPGQNQNAQSSAPRSEELSVATFDCIGTLCRTLEGREAAETLFNESGSSTVVDQAVYILLEAIVDDAADGVQLSAARALQALYSRITDRVVLASLMPRTVSALTKVLRPVTQARRSYKLLCCCLEILTEDLRVLLSDAAVSAAAEGTSAGNVPARDSMVLDASWLRATTSQVKLALANIIRVRNHDRPEVRLALLNLCMMIIDQCQTALEESLPMIIETVVVLSYSEDGHSQNEAYTALRNFTESSEPVASILKSNLHSWMVALPRVMQSNDDSAKQRAIRQVSTAFQILYEVSPDNTNILNGTMTTSLCDSVAASIRSSSNVPQPLQPAANTGLEVGVLNDKTFSLAFPPVLMGHGSQTDTLTALKSMVAKLNNADVKFAMTRLMLNRLHRESGDGLLAPFWLCMLFLKSVPSDMDAFEDLLDLGTTAEHTSKAGLIEELYAISVPILTELGTANPDDWRLPALALEAVALQAQQLGDSFRPELIDTLYPVLQLMGSSNPGLQSHAMTCLNIMTNACGYLNASTMLVDNVDYLVNAVGLKLNTFDLSLQAPQVLLMMVKLCGARLIPYLDDLVGSIFAVIDSFHGYPKLVELLFTVLGTIVDESAKRPATLAITDTDDHKPVERRKRSRPPTSVSDLVKEFGDRRKKRNLSAASTTEATQEETASHPKQLWSSLPSSGKEKPPTEGDEDLETDSQADQAPPQEEEKVLSKPHTLLLNIVKSIPPHLSSPSPVLRRSLLSILSRALPVLSLDGNSFLPLINEIWPSVSARITLSQGHTSHGSSLALSTVTSSSADPKPATVDQAGIQEETFVIVASCNAIETMCRGAGDFMSSRVEQDFPRWKKLYLRSWDRVRQDSENAAERQQLRLQQQQKTTGAVSKMERLSLLSKSGSSASTLSAKTEPLPPPPPPSSASKSFSSHHAIFRALTSLLTTLLTHVRLPEDILDEISHCLGSWISFYYPEYYFSFSWRQKSPQQQQQYPEETSKHIPTTTPSDDDIDVAIQAMHTWNADLTWFIFVEGRAKAWRASLVGLQRTKRSMDQRAREEVVAARWWYGSGGVDEGGVTERQQCRFADLVF
jgi:hypothetical protein